MRATLKFDGAIRTESNLNSQAFFNIAASLGLSKSKYEARSNFIDESLLKRRNSIAHGEYLDLELDDMRALADSVIRLIQDFKTDIENSASLESYRLPDTGDSQGNTPI